MVGIALMKYTKKYQKIFTLTTLQLNLKKERGLLGARSAGSG